MSLKMEDLLEAALRRRPQTLKHLRDCGKVGNCYITHEIAEADMNQVYKDWQRDVSEWMNKSTLTKYQNLKRAGNYSKKNLKKAQAFLKRAFNTYLQQLFGSKFLLHKLIQLPLVQNEESGSAEPCAALHHFVKSLHMHQRPAQTL